MGKTTGEPPSSPTSGSVFFERFWSALAENQLKIDRQIEEVDKRYQKQQEEKRLQLEESEKKFLRQMEERNRLLRESGDKYQRKLEESNRQIKESGTRFQHNLEKTRIKYRDEPEEDSKGKKSKKDKEGIGLLKTIERMVSKKAEQAASLHDCFREAGYRFNNITGSRKIFDGSGEIKAEIDMVLENVDCIMAVAVCSKPKAKDIEEHINRLYILRDNFTANGSGDKYHDTRKIYGAIMGKKFGSKEMQAVLEAGLFAVEQEGNSMNVNKPEGIPREC